MLSDIKWLHYWYERISNDLNIMALCDKSSPLFHFFSNYLFNSSGDGNGCVGLVEKKRPNKYS